MKSYLDLVPISAKIHRRQNRMTLICIAIAVFLVTSIFSMADMSVRMYKNDAINKHGYWHISLNNMPDEDAALIALRPEVHSAEWYEVANYGLDEGYSIAGKTACVIGAEHGYIDNIMVSIKPAEGRYPQTENEIMLTELAKTTLGLSLGDTAMLSTPQGSFEYTIVGFGGDNSYSAQADFIGAFITKAAFTAMFEGSSMPPATVYIRFKDSVNARRVIADIRAQFNPSEGAISENTALMGVSGYSSDSYVVGIYGVAAVLFVLVLAAGVLMIAGSLNSKVAERTRFFGMLRCIGASKAQVAKFVRLEALTWCKTAVPLGVGAGVAATWLLCAVMHYGVGGEFAAIPLFNVSPIGIVCGAVVGLFTVLLSARAPAKRAARVSPMAAVAGSTQGGAASKRAAGTGLVPIDIALGIHHAVSAKKNLLLMTGSFALSIVMFLCFSVMIAWTGFALTPLRAYAPDLEIYSESSALSPALAEKIAGCGGVKRVYGRMHASLPAQYQGVSGSIDLISYEEHQFSWAKDDLSQGSIEKVKQNLDSVLTVFDKSNTLTIGDTIALESGTVLTVAGVLEDSPFDATDTPTVICSEETFTALTGQTDYAIVDVQLSTGATEDDVNAIRALAGEDITFSDRREGNKEVKSVYLMFSLVVYSFLAIIAMITVLNIVNSIAMSAAAKTRQYGAMRAVGMAGRQITRMIAAEAATYAVLGFAAGCLLGIPLYKIFYQSMITNYWGTAWQPPYAALAVITLIIVLACTAAVYAPAKRMRSMMVTETINEL